jgi:parallel beta-helix repeat protein
MPFPFARSTRRAAATALLLISSSFGVQAAELSWDRVHWITSCGVTLTSAGVYTVAADLSTTEAITCITITGNGVTLLLNGHTLTGNGDLTHAVIVAAPPTNSEFAVSAVKILGPGIVTGGLSGLEFEGAVNSYAEGITSQGNLYGFNVNSGSCGAPCFSAQDEFTLNTATNNFGPGFSINGTENSLFSKNVASNNASNGFLLYLINNSEFTGNTADGNGQDGFIAQPPSSGNILLRNTASGNANYDGEDQNSSCGTDIWATNSFGTVNQSCVK